jgi:MarR family
MSGDTPTIVWLPAVAGSGLCMGAIGLLTADALSTGRLTLTHALQPLLVLGTVAAAVLAHQSGWRRPVNTLLFVLLAGLGSLATIYGTLGRQADARDAKVGTALAENRTLQLRSEALDTAKTDAKRECASGVGQRCTAATARVDKLVGEMASLRTVSPDPRADAIADLLWLVASVDKARVQLIVAAIDPLLLPIFLELGSVIFFAASFPTRATLATLRNNEPTITVARRPCSQSEALAQFRQMREVGAQQFLADQWGVDKSTVSRWLRQWETEGLIRRQRDGRCKSVALPGRNALLLPRRSSD